MALSSRGGLWIKLAVSLAIPALFYLLLRRQIDLTPSSLAIEPWGLPVYAAALVPYFLTRALRWHYLLRPLGAIARRDAVLCAFAGFMWIVLLPLRLGEFARPFFLGQRSSVPPAAVLGTIAIERVVDGLCVSALFFGATALRPYRPESELVFSAALGVLSLFTVALLGLLVFALRPDPAATLLRGTVGRVWPTLGARMVGLMRTVATGLAALPRARHIATFVAWSLLYWGVNVVGTWLLARACGVPLDVVQVAALVACVNIVLLVPAGPAQAGNFHGGVTLGLGLFLAAEAVLERGSAFVFYLYLCQTAATLLLGLFAQARLGLDWRALFRPSPLPPTPESSRAGD